MRHRYIWIVFVLVVIPLAGCGSDTVNQAQDKSSSVKSVESPGYDLKDGANPYEPGVV